MDNSDDSDSDQFSEEENSPDEDEEITSQRSPENDTFLPHTIDVSGVYDEWMQDMTDEEWEELGRDISNNTHLTNLFLYDGALNDHKMTFLFRGLTRSSSLEVMRLDENRFSVAGVRSMVPFLQNSINLKYLLLGGNNIQSVGFNLLFRALSNSQIETLSCENNGIESIEIDRSDIPKHLKTLYLECNCINADGCREFAKLLQGGNSTLTILRLNNNKIDDEGVAILVNALQSNTQLEELSLINNEGISVEGAKLCLRLVNDISSIKATLQSNRTLCVLAVDDIDYSDYDYDDDGVISQIQVHINNALDINTHKGSEAAGREKVVLTQLHSGKRAKLANFLGVDRSLYSEINPLHLPEVLSLVGRHHGQGELYAALKSSIAGVISAVNRKEFIQQQIVCAQQKMSFYATRLEELGAELASINEAEGDAVDVGESSSKRRRKWWWGLWGMA
jgi:hypothetical protein